MPSPGSPGDQRALPSQPISLSLSTSSPANATNKSAIPTTSPTTPNQNQNVASIASPASTSAWTRRITLPPRSVSHPDFLRNVALQQTRVATSYGRVTEGSPSTVGHATKAMAGRRSSFTQPSSLAGPASDKQVVDPQTPSGSVSFAGESDAADLGLDHLAGPGDAAGALMDIRNSKAKNRDPDGSASQKQLHDYRERLARDLERRELHAQGVLTTPSDKNPVSPIVEEAVSSPPLSYAGFPTASTESNHTVRGSMTPAHLAGTPSYPFPRMTSSGFASHYLNKSLPLASPPASNRGTSQPMLMDYRGSLDRVVSENSTPVSQFTFNPSAVSPRPETFDFPTPSLYDLSLMLTAEPGLDAWWNTVIQIMRDVYKAERVTLSVPADTTDIENVPWGQKATYSEKFEDELSMGYAGRGSSTRLSSDYDYAASEVIANTEDSARPSTATRPNLPSRHSFTTYEENKQRSQAGVPLPGRRPAYMARSKTQFPLGHRSGDSAVPHAQLDKKALDEHDAEEEQHPQDIPSWEAPFMAHYEGQGRVMSVLQALDYEADPLIDHIGVARVLQRGKTVALTRSYPYLAKTEPIEAPTIPKPTVKPVGSDSSKSSKRQRSESVSKLSSIFAGSTSSRGSARSKVHFNDKGNTGNSSMEDDEQRPPTPRYEEYEQAPPSPWSQSPAPSPAVRSDPKENPFFTDAMIDEDSFNPGSSTSDYTGMPPPEAIGVDNSWTVLHIPLTHVLLSTPTRPFKLDATAMGQKSQQRSKDDPGVDYKDTEGTSEATAKSRPVPIAILSVLSPIIPYPSNLRHSLEHLAPHMATTFSLCRHYSNLETELAGIQRRRPPTTGFGAVAPYARTAEGVQGLPSGRPPLYQSLAGSMTSPSDYSGISRSAAGSPIGTPGWEPSSLNFLMDKRQPAGSPAAIHQGGEGYFNSKQRSTSTRQDAWAPSGNQGSRGGSKASSPGDQRLRRLSGSKIVDNPDLEEAFGKSTPTSDSQAALSQKELPGDRSAKAIHRKSMESVEELAEEPIEKLTEGTSAESGSESHHEHTMLHSYGADFASTFQSLPPSSTVGAQAPPGAPPPSKSSSSISPAVDMPPPSDRLKGLILDSLPAHVFVALPQTGEIVWVNSRFLSYRGQNVVSLAADPWGSIHRDDRKEYLKAWGHSLRTGEQFSRTVRIRRFDGSYRWFYARAVASKDKRGVIMQFLGSYMDIHDQHIAELKAARQEEIEASEAKHRLLANLIPQIIFAATEDDGITFANEQWLSYTGQNFEDSLGLGFMDHVHPDDLARCRIPFGPAHAAANQRRTTEDMGHGSAVSSEATPTGAAQTPKSTLAQEQTLRAISPTLPRTDSSTTTGSTTEPPTSELTELARKGVIKVATDSNGRVFYTTEVRLRSKSGEYRWHLIRCVEIDTIDFGRGASSYFGSATDINDHKLLEAKLKEAMESKGRFLSNMSHEIRTPLIGISGMVSFLQDTILNEEQRDYSNTIQTSANSLIMIINDILDLSKVDAGMMKLKYEWFHTRSLIEDVNELVSTMAIAKRLELNYLVEADVPAWVKGDKVRIRQVLLNVIGNAIKFTSEGEVFSRCRVFAEDNHGGAEANDVLLQFSITDTGQGFSKKEAELIFKPFSQIDGSSTRQHGGSGLGLVISRQLVELHGGKMEGTAEVGKGSTFTFTARFSLPTAEDHPALPGSPASTISATSRRDSLESVPRSLKPLPPPTQHGGFDHQPGASSESASTQKSHPSHSDEPLNVSRPHLTERQSATSVDTGLARFSEAAKASGQDLAQINLEIPLGRGLHNRTLTPPTAHAPSAAGDHRPPVYSILLICPQNHSREATTQHIEMTLPKDMPHQIIALGTVEDVQQYICGDDPVQFTHVVVNLGSADAIISVMDQITESQNIDRMTILILSDSVQRQALAKKATGTKYERLLSDNLVTFIYKPVKPSRFAVIFDPDKVQDLSTDRNRSTAQQMVESQKASYQEIEKRMGKKGYKILLVEDNLVNQKVLKKYLEKIGVDVEIAIDGVECTDRVLSKPHKHFSLILCDLHMPRKDGYQACREIRQWEKASNLSEMPIIALSANVMSNVQEKCVAAGFSDYVTKPVDFIDLSRAMAKFF